MLIQFKIETVRRISNELVECVALVNADYWKREKAKGRLGVLYGIDLSNAIYHEFGVKAYCPSVGDRDRARNGVKRITLTYQDSAWNDAPDNVIKINFADRPKAS